MHIKDKILIEVAKSEWLYKASKTISPLFHDDLAQHLLLILCEMPDDKLTKVYNDGYIKLFCIKIMWSQSSTPRQKFYDVMKPIGLFDIENVQIEYLNTIDDAIEKENKYKLIENVVSKNKWYEREIFTMWSNGESARSIHRKTKITLREVLRVIKEIKRQIINDYE